MKHLKFSAVAAAAAAFVMILVSCGAGSVAAEIKSQSETSIVIEAMQSGGSLADALEALKDAGSLDFSASESEYGLFIESVNGRAADPSANEYWAIYTTLGELDGVSYSSSEYGAFEADGKTLASASYGASGLPMQEGELYALVLESY